MRAWPLLLAVVGCDAVPELVFDGGDASIDASSDASSRPDVMNPCESDAALPPNTICCGGVPCEGQTQKCMNACADCAFRCYDAGAGLELCCPTSPKVTCKPLGSMCM